MTVVEPTTAEGASHPVAPRPDVLSVLDVCPYLATDAGWRSTTAQRDQRCQAERPATRLALDQQRRLCLKSVHRGCPAYLAAQSSRAGRVRSEHAVAGGGRHVDGTGLWRFTRTAPAMMDDGRIGLPIPIAGRERTVPQAGLGALLVAVLAILVVVRLTGTDDVGLTGVAGTSIGTPAASAVAAATPTPSPQPSETPTASAEPSPSPTTRASPTGAVAGATGVPTARTYRVRSGDTLIAIATRFGTTVRALQAANGIDDPTRLRVGQVLEIPPPEAG